MKRMFTSLFIAGIMLFLTGCHIAGGDMAEYYSERFLREKGEPERLIQAIHGRKPLPPETFQRLTDYSDRAVNRMLAENSACPPKLLQKFSESRDWYVRRGVACNPNASYDLLKKLSRDSNDRVRVSLGMNPAIPEDIRNYFVDAGDWYAQDGLARNPSTPPDMLRKIYNRYKESSQHRIDLSFALNPKLPEDIARDIYLREKDRSFSIALQYIAMNPATPSSLLLDIYRDNRSDIRLIQYAQNPNCPEEIKEDIRNSNDHTAKELLK